MATYTFTIIYNSNGSGEASVQQRETATANIKSMKLKAAGTFTRAGYMFVGWGTSPTTSVYDVHPAEDSYLMSTGSSSSVTRTLYAIWSSPITYNISYALNGGTLSRGYQKTFKDGAYTYALNPTTCKYDLSNFTAEAGTTMNCIYIDHPVRTGYDFLGWTPSNYDNTARYWTAGDVWLPLDDDSGDDPLLLERAYRYLKCEAGTVTMTANWRKKTYTVKYNANGGTGAPSSQTKTYGVDLTLRSATPTRTGYTFDHWDTASDASGANYAPGGTYTKNAAVTLYAIWKANTYNVTYNANGGTGAPSKQTKTYGVDLKLSTVKPSRTGYKFVKWNTASGGTGTDYAPGDTYSANAAVTLYAQWQHNPEYSVTFDANGGTGAPSQQSAYGGIAITLSSTKPTRANTSATYTVTYNKVDSAATISKSSENCTRTTKYTFASWNTQADGKGDSYKPGDTLQTSTAGGSLTLYAQWTAKTTGSVDLPTGTLDQFTLVGWSTSKSSMTPVADPYSPGGNKTLYAIWQPNGMGGMLKFDWSEVPEGLEAGAKVRLTGLKANEGVYTVASVSQSGGVVTVYFEENFSESGEQNAADLAMEIYGMGTYVPDMDYICSLNNRLWGCSSLRRTIYASALGDPTDFFRLEQDALDAYSVGVGSAGDFTGCCAINNAVLFYKQHVIHKMMGSFPAEYMMYTYEYGGVSAGNFKSLANCDGTSLYVGEHGIEMYAGSSTGLLSRALGEGGMHNAVAGFNGQKYSLYFVDDDDNGHAYEYDMRYRIWIEKGYDRVLEFAHLEDRDYVLLADPEGNAIYRTDTGTELEGEWEITFRDFIETASSQSQSMIFEKKRYTALTVRIELPKGSWVQAHVRADGGLWRPAARLAGRAERVQQFKIRTPRCDRMQLRLSGHGYMKILGIDREFHTGSRR